MKKTKNEIRSRIQDCVTLFGFEYNGKDGCVDPYYEPGEGYSYLLGFGEEEQMVYDMDSVMNTPFIDGHTLAELADVIGITEW